MSSRLAAGTGVALMVLAAFPGCGGGHHEATQTGTAVVQITDLPFSELNSLELTITEVVLLLASEGTSVQVFPPAGSPGTTLTVDLVALQDRAQILGIARVPVGEITAAQITFGNVQATAGTPSLPQTVIPTSGSIRIDFVSNRNVQSNRTTGILLDFDGGASADSGGPGGVTFTPTVFEVGGNERSAVDEIRGVVTGIGSDRLTVAFNDGTTGGTSMGRLPVILGVDSVLRVDGTVSSGPSDLTSISEGDQAEVSGSLVAEGIAASLVQIDRINDLQEKRTVRVRGTVSGLSPFLLIVDDIRRDQLDALMPGSTVTVSTSASTSFARRTGSGPVGLSSFFVGQEAEVVGPLVSGTISADLVVLRESRITGTLDSLDIAGGAAVLVPDEINGVPAESLGFSSTVTLSLSTATGSIGGVVPFPLSSFAAEEAVRARGSFIPPPSNIGPAVFSVNELSLEELDDFSALPSSADLAAGTFSATVGVTPVTVMLFGSTRLAVRRLDLEDRVFNVDRDDFLSDLSRIDGSVSVRGNLRGGVLRAVRASMTILPPD